MGLPGCVRTVLTRTAHGGVGLIYLTSSGKGVRQTHPIQGGYDYLDIFVLVVRTQVARLAVGLPATGLFDIFV